MHGFYSSVLLAAAALTGSVSARPSRPHNNHAKFHHGAPYGVPSDFVPYAAPSGVIPAATGYHPTAAVPWGPTGTATSKKTRPTYLQGVNAGGHLIVEKWMTPELFEDCDAEDQWTLDQTDGAREKLEKHWDTYFTKDDFQAMKDWGLNAVRIPIGFWAYDNDDTPYLKGADKYLERMIEWCREIGLWVLVDCHGSPGSQNGFDNSGHSGKAHWQSGNNLDRSTEVLKTMAAKYGSMEYADVVYGIELANEPISWDENNLDVTQKWTKQAYKAVRQAAANKDLTIVMHDGFMGPSEWQEVGEALNSQYSSSTSASRFAVDTHLYQNQVEEDKNLTQSEHIDKACAWKQTNLLAQNASTTLPVFVGEFSASTDICANPDGSTVAGTACYIDGCQCANNVDIGDWQAPLKQATRKFFEAELEAFESGAQGWFLWSWKGPGGWGMENLIKEGVVGESVRDRKYEGQCKGASSY